MTRPPSATPTPSRGEMEVWRLDELAQHDQSVVLLRNSLGIHAAVKTRLLTIRGGTSIPFLSTHPGGEERIENLRQLIQSDR